MSRIRFLLPLATLITTQTANAIEYRSIDGRGNNQVYPHYGEVGQPLGRYASANYLDGIGQVDPSRPNPRVISNTLFNQAASHPDPRGLSNLTWAWGQFVDHDISHSLIDPSNGVLGIEIPRGDPVFDNDFVQLAGESILITRSDYEAISGVTSPRQQLNNVTSWLDASMVYGGRATDGPAGIDRPSWLRTGTDGRLHVSDGGGLGDMLPKYVVGQSPEMANTHLPTMGGAFVAGDVRANENPALLSLQTLFVREHNRLAGIVAGCGANLSDEEIFQRARKIVGAEIQTITYSEYLPSLGVSLQPYDGYDASVDPAIANEFANAAFRMGHSQVDGVIARVGEDGQPIEASHLDLVSSFFAPESLLSSGLEPIVRGLATTTQQATDAKLVDALRNQLFEMFIPGVGLVDNAVDLASVNIMRGRDHGLPTYNTTREALGLVRRTDFSDITADVDVQTQLASLYTSVEELDLYAGLLAEDPLSGGSIGETIATIFSDQFTRLRDGDRFWYQNNLDGVNDDLLCVGAWDGQHAADARSWLDSVTLADVIHLNTEMNDMSGNMFMAQPVPEPSSMSLLMLSCLFALRRRRI